MEAERYMLVTVNLMRQRWLCYQGFVRAFELRLLRQQGEAEAVDLAPPNSQHGLCVHLDHRHTPFPDTLAEFSLVFAIYGLAQRYLL